MPINYKLYHKNWKTEIRPAILSRANNSCEQCEVENYTVGYWDKSGKFWTAEKCIDLLEETEYDIFEHELSHIPIDKNPVKVVLTISHTDHDISNNYYSNLKALCQICHNRHDSKYRSENRKNKQPKLF